ncbi:inclusion membrane domain protein [Chlamydia ibidis]|uniref:Inclusion membrane domain protein n=2 Tax=Chlamydia ibidis TaxID=1405396 RepID=S7J2G0_9CHLA|nr:inclusion membrane protein IncB [Chlamydia ibidis]EPP34418.1 inclusion membrane domain protein [Chlamydia ibidis]EQM62704.1 inclusion membrane protein B [Chlamydia ibidis 10-1398/6]
MTITSTCSSLEQNLSPEVLQHAIEKIKREVSYLDSRLSTTSVTVAQSESALASLVAEVEDLKAVIAACVHSLRQNSDVLPSSQGSPQRPSSMIIEHSPPTVCSKLLATTLTLVALIAISLLVVCVVTACGGFPLFLSFLNVYTVGACIALPIISSVSAAILFLSMLSISSLLKSSPLVLVLENSLQSS